MFKFIISQNLIKINLEVNGISQLILVKINNYV